MAESVNEDLCLPPAYNDAIANHPHIVSGDGEQTSLPAAVYVDLTSAVPSYLHSTLPPPYESLVLPKVEDATPQATDRLDLALQTDVQPNSSNRAQAMLQELLAKCRSIVDSREFKVVCAVIALAMCLTLSVAGTVYTRSCPSAELLPIVLQLTGLAGVGYLVLTGCTFFCSSGDHRASSPFLLIILPGVLIALFLFGSVKAYTVWIWRPCNVMVYEACSHYCNGALMLFSVIFYSMVSILLIPLWLTIIYVLLRLLAYNIGRCFCKDKNCIKSDGGWIPCQQ